MDGVISTGVTMRMIVKLMEKVGAQIVQKIAVLKQGEQFDEIKNITYFAQIPIFKTEA